MQAERLDFFKKMLSDRRDALLREAGAELRNLVDPREAAPDALDAAVEETDRDFSLRLQDRERKLLHKIEEAVLRIQSGDYGTCEACGAEIDERRLLARPVATQCIDCQTEAEQMEPRRRAF